ncbi:MBL fold metallo-hydrolase [candidate division WWE3 bacterium]|uniref:MBL fold metallo-hydrolase n=1 Tax=candidate division WWE3 bacterium TaxID=2053526 RepID=A0A7X9DKQ2_UNCKA|nr:MBL fold metallo-hydrolase [candidate division WWE3 bacterium]
MEITYIGHSCFKIKGKESTIVIDPYDSKVGYKLPKLDADILLVSHKHFDHNNVSGVTGYRLFIDTPGEYETKGVFINGYPTKHDAKDGAESGPNTIFLVELEGVRILHLGDLGHELEQSTLEKIDTVDILMVPVGGKFTIDAELAAKVISSIEPGIVIPMHYKTTDLTGVEGLDSLDKFLDEMGVENNVKKLDKLKISGKNDIPLETEIFVLEPSH